MSILLISENAKNTLYARAHEYTFSLLIPHQKIVISISPQSQAYRFTPKANFTLQFFHCVALTQSQSRSLSMQKLEGLSLFDNEKTPVPPSYNVNDSSVSGGMQTTSTKTVKIVNVGLDLFHPCHTKASNQKKAHEWIQLRHSAGIDFRTWQKPWRSREQSTVSVLITSIGVL